MIETEVAEHMEYVDYNRNIKWENCMSFIRHILKVNLSWWVTYYQATWDMCLL